MLDEARKIEPIARRGARSLPEDDETRMKQNGVKVAEFGAKLAPKLNALYNEGILAPPANPRPRRSKQLWDLAKTKNLLKE